MKKIKINNLGLIELSLDEVLKRFERMAYDFAHECEREFKDYEYSIESFEDYVQIGNMELMRAYELYDYTKGYCFSTYASKCLKNRFLMIFRKLNAKKRKNRNIVSLNQEAESNSTLESFVSDREEKYFNKEFSVSLENFIRENMSKEEILYLIMDIKKVCCDNGKILNLSSIYAIDVLSDIIGVDTNKLTRSALAESLGITRPTLNKRITKAVIKARNLISNFMTRMAY